MVLSKRVVGAGNRIAISAHRSAGSNLFLAAGLILSMAGSLSPASAKGDVSGGRAGNWRSGAQGAPSVAACRKKVEANPKDAVAQNDLGWAIRQNRGDLKEAEQCLREAIKLNESMPQAHSNLSVVLVDEKKEEEAVTEARKAVELDGNQAIFHVVLGNALSATGDNEAAIKEYKTALGIHPDYENALYNLGRVQYMTGQKTEASSTLAQALKLDPEDERVLKLLDEASK